MTMTYNSLVNDIQGYCNRNDQNFINAIPGFILLAHNAMCREIKDLGIEKYVVSTFTAGLAVYPKPGRWRTPITLNYGTGNNQNFQNQMLLRTYEYLVSYWPDSSVLGLPLYYSDYGFSHIYVAPTPADNYPFKYSYLEMPDPITATNQTNYFTDYLPDALLYRCLGEAMSWLKNDDRQAYWMSIYQSTIDKINGLDTRRYQDRASERGAD